METLSKLLLTEWSGAPLLIWLLGILLLVLLAVLRVPFRFRRTTKKGELLLRRSSLLRSSPNNSESGMRVNTSICEKSESHATRKGRFFHWIDFLACDVVK